MKFENVYVDGTGSIANEDVRDDIRDEIRSFRGKHLDITIELHKDQRSQKANAYYWGCVLKLMADHTGHSADDLHDVMCARFLPSERKRLEFVHRMTGEHLEVETDGRRSSKLTGGPFYDFVEEVRMFAREFLDVETPDPDPAYWRKRARAA